MMKFEFSGNVMDAEGKKRQLVYLRGFLIVTSTLLLLATIFIWDEIVRSAHRQYLLLAICLVNIVAMLIINRRNLTMAMHIMAYGYWLLTTLTVMQSGGFNSPWLLSQLLVMTMGILLLGGWGGIGLFALTLTVNSATYFLQLNDNLPAQIMNIGIVDALTSAIVNSLLIAVIIFAAVNVMMSSIKRSRENDSRYRSLFEKTNDAVFLIDMNQRYVDVNQRAADLLGYEKDELIGMEVRAIVVPEEREKTQEKIGELNQASMIPVYERKVVCKDGSRKTVEVNVALISNQKGEPIYYQSVVRDVSERKHIEQELQYSLTEMENMAMHDSLTDTLNRRAIMDHAAAEWHRAARQKNPMCVVLIDVDNLKNINDKQGHLAGDKALINLATAINESKRPYDWAGRWGGDEFLMVLPGANLLEATEVAERVRQRAEESWREKEFSLHISAGISCFPGRDPKRYPIATILSQADNALYAVKESGKNRVGIFRDAENEKA